MKEKDLLPYKAFLQKFEESIKYLLADGGIRYNSNFINHDRYTLEINISVMFKKQIDLITSEFGDKWIMTTGILEKRDMIQIKID